MGGPSALAVTRDGTVYVAHGYSSRVRRIALDGRVSSVLGGGDDCLGSGDVVAATDVDLGGSAITSLAVTDDGRIWIAYSAYSDGALCLGSDGTVRLFGVGEAEAPLNGVASPNAVQNRRQRAGAIGINPKFQRAIQPLIAA